MVASVRSAEIFDGAVDADTSFNGRRTTFGMVFLAYRGEAQANQGLVGCLGKESAAEAKTCQPGGVALWPGCLAQKRWMVPIPGTTKLAGAN